MPILARYYGFFNESAARARDRLASREAMENIAGTDRRQVTGAHRVTGQMAEFRFREDSFDEAIHHHILERNEYGLPDRFEADDIVIDAGAHIGCFSWAAILRGAGRVFAIEADRTNYDLASRHLADEIRAGRVVLQYGAAWRSDENNDRLVHRGYTVEPFAPDYVNTGGGYVSTSGTGTETPNIPFDSLLLDATDQGRRRIRLLKIDCEGSEYPMLLTSQQLHLIDEIVGEFHEFGGEFDNEPLPFEIGGLERLTFSVLESHLQNAGFTCRHRRHIVPFSNPARQEHRGHFHAVRAGT